MANSIKLGRCNMNWIIKRILNEYCGKVECDNWGKNIRKGWDSCKKATAEYQNSSSSFSPFTFPLGQRKLHSPAYFSHRLSKHW